ncbi:unnamed protein product [Knipowitschia caucasica]
MQCVRGSVLFLSLLLWALCSADQSSESMDQGQDLDQDLDMMTRQRLLQRARSAGLLTQRAVEDLLLAQMSLPEPSAPKPLVPKGSDGHVTLQRSVEGNNNLPPRKEGCKNFFWKGKTAC